MSNGECSWASISVKDLGTEKQLPAYGDKNKRPVTSSCWKRLRAGGEGDERGWDGWMVSLTQWTQVWASSRETVKDREVWHAAVHGVAESDMTSDRATIMPRNLSSQVVYITSFSYSSLINIISLNIILSLHSLSIVVKIKSVFTIKRNESLSDGMQYLKVLLHLLYPYLSEFFIKIEATGYVYTQREGWGRWCCA